MKLTNHDLISFAGAQGRAWSGYFLWMWAGIPIVSWIDLLEYMAFLICAELIYQFVKPMFIKKEAR